MPLFLSPTDFLGNLLIAASVASTPVLDTQLQGFLAEGNFSEAMTYYQAKTPLQDSERLALALTYTLEAVETLAQDNYRLGLGNADFGNNLPFLRMPVPPNPQAETVTAQALRAMLLRFQEKIYLANQSLADYQGDSNFKIFVDLKSIAFTVNPETQEKIKFGEIYQRFLGEGDLGNLELHLDAADGFWLKAYTHLLLAMSDFALALDARPLFEMVGPWIFPQAQTTWTTSPFYDPEFDKQCAGFTTPCFVDLVAAVSQLRFRVSEPKRFQQVPKHLLEMIKNSRLMLKALAKESDDDQEWLPNPRQQSTFGSIRAEEYQAWEAMLKEGEALLTGQKLLGHWRVSSKYGFDIALFFSNPPEVFDPFLLYQGTAALPYLKKGSRSQRETWERLREVFQGSFIRFVIWVN